MKISLKIGGILVLGLMGGIIGQLFFIPWLINNPWFGKLEIIKNLKREVIVNPVEKFIIRENDGLKKAIEKVEGTVLKVGSERKREGCGFSLTSDGLIVAPLSLLTDNQDFVFLNGQKTKFRVLDQNEKENLVLLKVEAKNLKTASFADFGEIKAGEKVFLMGPGFVNQGIIKSLKENLIETNILEKKSASGCPLFNLEGQFVGLAEIVEYPGPSDLNQVFVLPASKIRTFAGL